MPKRVGFAGFSPQELDVIALRTNGVKPPEIARRLNLTRTWTYTVLWSAMRKAGVTDVCLLTRWAMANGFDERLTPERPEDLPKKEPKVFKGRIKLNRLGKAGMHFPNWPQKAKDTQPGLGINQGSS